MGKIHYQADDIYFYKHPEERKIVEPFLRCFNVTKAFKKTRGNDRVSCYYLKAEPFIAELIGLEKELLCIYAPFDRFQARTIKLHDEVIASDRTRLDPLGSVVVSDDPKTYSVVSDYLVSNPERPPIVALSLDELGRLNSVDDIRRLFVNQLFRRDLFSLESPLKTDTTFFGRSEIVAELLDRFRSGQNSGLFGLRRIGKSSVLYALMRRVGDGEIAGSIYLDVSSPGVYKLRWWELLQHIIVELARPLDLKRGERSKVRALSLKYQEKTAAKHFKVDILNLFGRFRGNRILLLLDEIEHITFDISPSEHWAEDFLPLWQSIRSVHQDTQGRFGFVVVGVNPHILEADRVGQYDNPLFSTTKPFYLGPLDRRSLRDMVRRIGRFMGLKCEESLYNKLYDEYGGHPFLVRQACSFLAKKVTSRPGVLTAELFETNRNHIALLLERNIRQILNVLAIWYPDEFEMVRMLAQGDQDTFVEFARGSATFTQHVEGYGLVKDARENPQLTIGLVQKYLSKVPRNPARIDEDTKDPEAVLAEISRRRNAIEIAFRCLLRDGLRFSEGKKAMHVVLNCLGEKRRAELAQFSYSQVWNEMYFSELIAVISKNWGAFQKRLPENKDKVITWMEHINKCRADAHARELNEEDLAFLKVCFRRIEELLDLDS